MKRTVRLAVLAIVAITGLAPAAATTAAGASASDQGTASGGTRAPLTYRPATSAGGTQLWAKQYHGLMGAGGRAAAMSPNGSAVFVTGDFQKKGGLTGGETVAYNPATGAMLWATAFNPGGGHIGGSSSVFVSIAVSPDGGTVFVAGSLSPTRGARDQYVTVAYNATTGARLWAATGVSGLLNSIAVSPSGSTVFVTGQIINSGAAVTVAYRAATGATLWTANTGVASDGVSVAVAPDGSAVIVTGSGAVAVYKAATGATIWAHSLTFGPTSVAVSPDGSKIYVAGASGSSPTTFGTTAAYNAATGAKLWSQTSTNPGGYNAVAVSPDGSRVFATGTWQRMLKHRTSRSILYGTVAYNATTGTPAWANQYRGPLPSTVIALNDAQSVAVNPAGSEVFITGYATVTLPAGTGNVMATVAYDAATGAKLWTASYVPDGIGDAVVVSPNGSKVFAVGSTSATGPAIATVAYGT